MKALLYEKSIPKFVWVRALSFLQSEWALGPGSLLRLTDLDRPELPGHDWVRIRPRLSGICGSDIATIQATGSPYFSPMVSTPFVPGHEIVGEVEEASGDLRPGTRVVVEPVLHCEVRGLVPKCAACQAGETGRCARLDEGGIAAGVQTGYCRSTGGGWSGSLVAHRSQVHEVPDPFPDEAAVLVEPLACAVHAVASNPPRQGEKVLVIGCGSIGLLVIAALRGLGFENPVLASARHGHQKDWAERLGATNTVPTGRPLFDEIARVSNGEVLEPEVGAPVVKGGIDLVYDCVAKSTTLNQSMRLTRPGGRVVLVGMPAIPFGVDWTAIWHRELEVLGAYAYGQDTFRGEERRTFEIAIEVMQSNLALLPKLVTHRYPLARYKEALGKAMNAGKEGAVKVVFDLTAEEGEPEEEEVVEPGG